uniref:Gustatory receptor n=1 Tax=Panagrolaimus sp. PS1159 TaxID=55785 RepID=A0AC35FU52_9BILA
MPAMVAERVFATILIKDYEFNPRRWIFIIIAIFEFFMSFSSVYLFYYENLSELYFLTFILFLDVTAFIIYLICEYINLRRYQRYFRTNLTCFKHVMSLSERFQLAENIKSSRVFKPLAILVTIFNILLVAIGLAKPLNLGIFAKNIIYLLFELNIVVYAVCIPSITLFRNQIWRNQIYQIFSKIAIIKKCLPKIETNTVHLRNTFGKNMILNVDRQQNYYFKELNKSWNYNRQE